MTEDTATRSKHAAGKSGADSLEGLVAKAKSWMARLLSRHHERAASLRVYSASRVDGRGSGADASNATRDPGA